MYRRRFIDPDEMETLRAGVVKELASGAGKGSVIARLVREGWENDFAVDVVNAAENGVERYVQEEVVSTPEGRRHMKGEYQAHMVAGFLLFVAGLTLTIFTVNTGPVAVIWWGAIVFGALDFLYGWSKSKSV